MSERILQGKGIVKQYRKQEVLHNIDLTLEQGKIYGLIGRNGAGKTTLLSILSAQNPATAGEVLLDKEKVWENPKALEHIFFSREFSQNVSSESAGMKVNDYLKMAEAYLPKWDKAMAEELLRIFHLDKKKKLQKLSKGMLSMLSIILALASKADFTFLDEPVSGLDVVAREQFYRLLLEEFTESGRTFVISTHIIEEASELFEEVIFLHEGRILLKENTQELLAHSFHVSGRAEEVDQAAAGKDVHHEEIYGRSKSVMVKLREGEHLEPNPGITIQPMNLQKVFVALCAGEDEKI